MRLGDRLTEMLRLQLKAQIELKNNPLFITDIEEQIQYLKDMVLGATDELHEALGESGWKPWQSGLFINSKEAFGELRDAWQLIMNAMFLVTGASPEELADLLVDAHAEKVEINIKRARSGEAPKCEQCRRALDEIDVKEVKSSVRPGVIDLHCVCGAYLGSRPV